MDNQLSIDEVISQHYSVAFRYALRLSGRVADAEDITQQAFAMAHQRLDQVRDPERVDRWLLAIVRTEFLKTCRHRRPVSCSNIEFDLENVPEPPSHSDDIDREKLALALNELPVEFRMPVLMFYFEQLSYHEIAVQLEIPAGTVMSRLSRAKAYLRRSLTADPDSRDASEKKVTDLQLSKCV